ncbi:Attacin [Operophtera brumata]|uniref:Attacin n=1 Tax=Operophtera brumata TaxID=104452 RepID=A0A0L7LN68_OPEBR|nr:Attacin [Operophtera brumata]
MFSFKLLIAAAALVCVGARHIVFEDETGYYLLPIEDLENIELVPARAGRMRRQVQGSATVKSDGTSGANVRIPIVSSDRNALSAIGTVGLTDQLKVGETTYGLALSNIEGHSATLTKSHFPGADRVTAAGNVNLYNSGDHKVDVNAFAARTMPEAPHQDSFNTFGTGAEYMYNGIFIKGWVGPCNRLRLDPRIIGIERHSKGHSATLSKSHFPGADRVTAAGNVNLYKNGDHKVDVNAFAARTMPEAPHQDSFNTFGTGAEYMYKEKLGGEVNVVHTPLWDKTDYSAAGKLNLFKDSDSSWDFKAGVSKSVSPFIPKSSWEPNYGFSFTKWF